MTKKRTSTGMYLAPKPEKPCEERLEYVLRDNEKLAGTVDDLRELLDEARSETKKVMNAMVPAIMQIDHRNSYLISYFVEAANDSLIANKIPYRFVLVNTADEFDVKVRAVEEAQP